MVIVTEQICWWQTETYKSEFNYIVYSKFNTPDENFYNYKLNMTVLKFYFQNAFSYGSVHVIPKEDCKIVYQTCRVEMKHS